MINTDNTDMTCPDCGTVAMPTPRTCAGCGISLESLKRCAKCRGFIKSDWTRCVWCQSSVLYQSLKTSESKPSTSQSTSIQTPPFEYEDIVYNAFDRLIERIGNRSNGYRSKLIDDIRDEVNGISRRYWSGTVPRIPFNDPKVRMAYLVYRAPLTAYIIETIINNDDSIKSCLTKAINKSGNLYVSTLGGGPGAEILGVARWVLNQNFQRRTNIIPRLTDKEPNWEPEWEALRDSTLEWLDRQFGRFGDQWPVAIGRSQIRRLDIQDPESLAKNQSLLKPQNFLIISYVLSDIYEKNGLKQVQRFYSDLSAQVGCDTTFLFIDRDEPKWKSIVTEITDAAGMRLLGQQRHNSLKVAMEMPETSQYLGTSFGKLGHQTLRHGAFFWSVAAKAV